jgi:hypothetical protein
MVREDITAYRMEHHHPSSSWMHDVPPHLVLLSNVVRAHAITSTHASAGGVREALAT